MAPLDVCARCIIHSPTIPLRLARFKNLLFLQGCKLKVLGRTETIRYEQSDWRDYDEQSVDGQHDAHRVLGRMHDSSFDVKTHCNSVA